MSRQTASRGFPFIPHPVDAQAALLQASTRHVYGTLTEIACTAIVPPRPIIVRLKADKPFRPPRSQARVGGIARDAVFLPCPEPINSDCAGIGERT